MKLEKSENPQRQPIPRAHMISTPINSLLLLTYYSSASAITAIVVYHSLVTPKNSVLWVLPSLSNSFPGSFSSPPPPIEKFLSVWTLISVALENWISKCWTFCSTQSSYIILGSYITTLKNQAGVFEWPPLRPRFPHLDSITITLCPEGPQVLGESTETWAVESTLPWSWPNFINQDFDICTHDHQFSSFLHCLLKLLRKSYRQRTPLAARLTQISRNEWASKVNSHYNHCQAL